MDPSRFKPTTDNQDSDGDNDDEEMDSYNPK